MVGRGLASPGQRSDLISDPTGFAYDVLHESYTFEQNTVRNVATDILRNPQVNYTKKAVDM